MSHLPNLNATGTDETKFPTNGANIAGAFGICRKIVASNPVCCMNFKSFLKALKPDIENIVYLLF